MKILLTGKNGQVGYELERSLQCLGEVVAVDRSQMDLADLDHVRDIIRSIRPDLIVNAAAYTAVDRAESEPELAMRINGEAPGIMAQEANRLGAAMIHYSTDYVFDGAKPGAYAEHDVPCPVNAYGRSKLAGEQAIQASGIPHLILRTSWVYGMRGNNFLMTVRRLAQERDELRIVANQYGAPTWCRTIADATACALVRLAVIPGSAQAGSGRIALDAWREKSGIYHLAAQGQTSWYQFAQAIVARLHGMPGPVVRPIDMHDYPAVAMRPANSALSCERFISTFCRLPDWEAALKLCQE